MSTSLYKTAKIVLDENENVLGLTDAVDTCTDAVFLHTMDIHYQSTNMATKGKAPSFYA